MSRGARGDLQVLRSFRAKPASAWEGVPQEVRDHGDAILMKVRHSSRGAVWASLVRQPGLALLLLQCSSPFLFAILSLPRPLPCLSRIIRAKINARGNAIPAR